MKIFSPCKPALREGFMRHGFVSHDLHCKSNTALCYTATLDQVSHWRMFQMNASVR